MEAVQSFSDRAQRQIGTLQNIWDVDLTRLAAQLGLGSIRSEKFNAYTIVLAQKVPLDAVTEKLDTARHQRLKAPGRGKWHKSSWFILADLKNVLKDIGIQATGFARRTKRRNSGACLISPFRMCPSVVINKTADNHDELGSSVQKRQRLGSRSSTVDDETSSWAEVDDENSEFESRGPNSPVIPGSGTGAGNRDTQVSVLVQRQAALCSPLEELSDSHELVKSLLDISMIELQSIDTDISDLVRFTSDTDKVVESMQAPYFDEFRDEFSEFINQRREMELSRLAESRRWQDKKLKSRSVIVPVLKYIEDTREECKALKVEIESLLDLSAAEERARMRTQCLMQELNSVVLS